ncbi:MAG: LLM class flavin-dependent oxidoreductase [Acidimicrobiia bacterium]
MPLGFGLLSAQRGPHDVRSWEDVYDETIDLAIHLEKVGFDSVWTTEHHFVDDGYMPSLLVTSAAIAASTETISIGTGVVLAPLHRPIRLAEDAATVQTISRGRLILGLGLGWSKVEYDLLGVDMSRRGAAMTEILRFLPLAWTGEPFVWDGEVYSYPEIAIRPAPAEPIPVLVGGGVDAAVQRAARYADGFFSNASPTRFAEQVKVGTAEMERIGRDPSTFRWIYYAIMYPGPIDDIVESVWQQAWKYSDMGASATRTGIAEVPALTPDMRSKMEKRVLAGSAEQIADSLHEIRSQAGVPIEWVARSHFSDLEWSRQVEIADILAEDVLPIVPIT